MVEERAELLSQDDLDKLAKSHGTNKKILNNLLYGGVRTADLEEVLGIREFLSRWRTDPNERTNIYVDRVSAEALAKAYTVVGGDLEELELLADHAKEYASQFNLTPG